MGRRLRVAAVPAYLFLCLLLGGSGQGIWANMVLQLLGLALICWSAVARTEQPQSKGQRTLLILVALGLALVLAQLVPLPFSLWRALGPRETIAADYQLLGVTPTWLPLSVAPYDSLTALLALIPPVAVLAAGFRLGIRPLPAALALVAGTLAGILLGALQVSSPDPTTSPWYLYAETNFGVATGFFANANHMALLLVITLPFLTAMLARAGDGKRNVQRLSGALALVAGAALVIAVGIALNGSLAGYGLAIPVLLASVVIAFPGRASLRWLTLLAAISMIGAVGWLSTMPIGSSAARSSAETSVQSRHEMLVTSLEAAKNFMPFGSGVGSFQRVYALYEDHDRLDPTTFVNHAHDDYVELALETGVPGVILLAAFLLWWANAAWAAWRRPRPDPFALAASVASAAVLLHSVVDFPLRTAAISACFAMCLVLLIRQRRAPPADPAQLRPTRHVVVG